MNVVNEQMYIEYLIEELPSILKEHGDYHWFSMKQATTNNAKEEWPVYADLSYLDTYMPWGDDFKRFSDRYMEREREAARRMADMFAS